LDLENLMFRWSRKRVLCLNVSHEIALGDTVMHDERWNTILAQEVRMVDYAVALELQKEAPQLDSLYLHSEETTLEHVKRDLKRILFEVPVPLPGLPGQEPAHPPLSLRELLGKLCKKGHHPFDAWNAVRELINAEVFVPEARDAMVFLTTSLPNLRALFSPAPEDKS